MTKLYPGIPEANGIGGPDTTLTDDEIRSFVTEQLGDYDFDGKRVTLVVPDGTRHAPVAKLAHMIRDALGNRPKDVGVVIALGTHDKMSEEAIGALMGYEPGHFNDTFPGWQIFNHEWWDEDTFANQGTIPADKIKELSGGRLEREMVVHVNKMVVDTDITFILGPVLPHEVVGISGGNKYLFPGLSGHDVINMSHWVGALITSFEMIGSRGITPVRQMIDAAASLVPSTKIMLGMIVKPGGGYDLHYVAFGDVHAAWEACAKVSADVHVKYVEKPYRRVVSIMPTMYEDMWTAAKGFYKLEPIVADGGELIIYAPHIDTISHMHPDIVKIGYHNRDYFVKQWDKFEDKPWGDLAHSTHLRGKGTFDPETGTEENRVTVTLATKIPREVVESINLSYMDPEDLDFEAVEADPDTLVVPHAGELLHRVEAHEK